MRPRAAPSRVGGRKSHITVSTRLWSPQSPWGMVLLCLLQLPGALATPELVPPTSAPSSRGTVPHMLSSRGLPTKGVGPGLAYYSVTSC